MGKIIKIMAATFLLSSSLSCKKPVTGPDSQTTAALKALADEEWMIMLASLEGTEQHSFEVCRLRPGTLIPQPSTCINAFRSDSDTPVTFQVKKLLASDPSEDYPALSSSEQAQLTQDLTQIKSVINQRVEAGLREAEQIQSVAASLPPESVAIGMASVALIDFARRGIQRQVMRWFKRPNALGVAYPKAISAPRLAFWIVSAVGLLEAYKVILADPIRKEFVAEKIAGERAQEADLLLNHLWWKYQRIPLVVDHFPALMDNGAAVEVNSVEQLVKQLALYMGELYGSSDTDGLEISQYCLPKIGVSGPEDIVEVCLPLSM